MFTFGHWPLTFGNRSDGKGVQVRIFIWHAIRSFTHSCGLHYVPYSPRESHRMNPFNSLMHALRDRGGYATNEELAAVRPKLKELMKASVAIVDAGLATWVDGKNGEQELRLTDAALERMAGTELKFTRDELLAALNRGEDFSGRTIYVKRSADPVWVPEESESAGDDSDFFASDPETRDDILEQLREHAREQLAAKGYDPHALVTLPDLEEMESRWDGGPIWDAMPQKSIYVIADVKEFLLRSHRQTYAVRAHAVELFQVKGVLYCHATDEDMKTASLSVVQNHGPLLVLIDVEGSKVRRILRSRPRKPQPQYRDEWNLLMVGYDD